MLSPNYLFSSSRRRNRSRSSSSTCCCGGCRSSRGRSRHRCSRIRGGHRIMVCMRSCADISRMARGRIGIRVRSRMRSTSNGFLSNRVRIRMLG